MLGKTNAEKCREYRQAHLSQLQVKDRERYWLNREARKQAVIDRYWDDPEHARNIHRVSRVHNLLVRRAESLKWAKDNPERTKHIKQAWLMRKKLMDARVTADYVQQIYEANIKRFGTLTCVLCLESIKFGDDSIDHDIPISKGGTHKPSNLNILHWICNDKKKARTLAQMRCPEKRGV